MKKLTIFVDESGTLPDTKDKVIIIAAVATDSPEKIERIIRKVRKKLKISSSEFKSYTAGIKSKKLFFESISKEPFHIFILTVEKMGRKIPDTPVHFAILCWLLLKDVLNFYKNIEEIIFDRHFHKQKDVEMFNSFLQKNLENLSIKHVDSKKNIRVTIADMVAGEILTIERKKEDKFYKLFKKQIVSERRINWPEAKRKLFFS